MNRLTWMVASTVLALAAPAFAQEKVIREEDRTVVRKKTVIDFSDVAVEGEGRKETLTLGRRDGEWIHASLA